MRAGIFDAPSRIQRALARSDAGICEKRSIIGTMIKGDRVAREMRASNFG